MEPTIQTQKNLSKIKEYILDKKFHISFLLILFIFHKFFEEKITTYIVVPFSSKAYSHTTFDYLFITASLLLIFYIFYFKICNKFRFSTNHLITNITILIIYFIYRNCNNIWIFIPTESIEPFVYLDIIPIYSFLALSSPIFNYFLTWSDNKKQKNIGGFMYDEPLQRNEPDLLNRARFAKNIAKKIRNTYIKKSSFAIGITGKWGTGKTSFFSLIEEALPKSETTIIHFNPWLNNGAESISKDFFTTLANELKKHDSSLEDEINEYSNSILETSFIDKGATQFLKKIFIKHKSLKEEFDDINEVISKLNRKIIIFIDDLDRLYPEEIIETIKIIRNTANFSNTFFIASYDKEYITNAVKKLNNRNPQEYIEKIFQLEVSLPKHEYYIIENKIIESLNPKLTDEDSDLLNKIFNDNIFSYNLGNKRPAFEKHIFTLRDVTRFCNSFLLTYELLKKNTLLLELLNVEMLRVKYLEVYQKIFEKDSKYIRITPILEQATSGRENLYQLAKSTNEETNEEYLLEIDLHDKNIFPNINNKQIPNILHLASSIFTPQTYYKPVNPRSILVPSSFHRYSYFRLLDSNLSYIEFDESRKKDSIETFKSNITTWISKGLRKDLELTFKYISNFDNKNDFKKIIGGFLHLMRTPYYNGFNQRHNIFLDELIEKLDYERSYSLRSILTLKELQEYTYHLFKNAPSPYIADSHILFNSLEENQNKISLTIEKSFECRLLYLKKHFKESKFITSDTLILFDNCDTFINGEYKKNLKAIKEFKNNINEQNLESFLNSIIIRRSRLQNMYTLHSNVITLFKSYDEFEIFLEKSNPSEFLKEFNHFYKIQKENQFRNYTEIDFNHLKPF